MWADLAMSGIKQIGGFIMAKRQAENDRKWQEYNNKMLMLQGAQQQNAVTTNENIAREASAEEAFLISRSEYKTSASAEVAAAVTGTEGNSVNAVMRDLRRNAAATQNDRLRDLDYKLLGFDEQRKQLAMQTKLSLDNTDIPDPNPFTYANGFMAESASSLKEIMSGFKMPSFGGRGSTAPAAKEAADPWTQNGVNYRL